MGIGEGMCYGECCEVCKPGDSQTCTPGANNTLYVYKKKFKNYKLKKRIRFVRNLHLPPMSLIDFQS